MEVRGYDANVQRTSYRTLQWQIKDTIVILAMIPIAGLMFVLKLIECNALRILVNICYQGSNF